MSAAELEALALAVAKLAFVAGLVGAIVMHLLMLVVVRLAHVAAAFVQRRQRIAAAAQRAARTALAAGAEGDQWRACERLGDQRAALHA